MRTTPATALLPLFSPAAVARDESEETRDLPSSSMSAPAPATFRRK